MAMIVMGHISEDGVNEAIITEDKKKYKIKKENVSISKK